MLYEAECPLPEAEHPLCQAERPEVKLQKGRNPHRLHLETRFYEVREPHV